MIKAVGKQPFGHSILIVTGDYVRCNLFQFGSCVGNSVAFIGNAEHGDIVYSIAETDNAAAAQKPGKMQYGIGL